MIIIYIFFTDGSKCALNNNKKIKLNTWQQRPVIYPTAVTNSWLAVDLVTFYRKFKEGTGKTFNAF